MAKKKNINDNYYSPDINDDILIENLSSQIFTNYKNYAMSVGANRAVPGIDGLLPVQRRSLYGTYLLTSSKSSSTKKCSKIVGDVMGSFHPHGDSSIYGSLCNMAVEFKTKQPLFTGQGNLGTLMGDGAAAMRYTEAKLNEFSLDCIFKDLKESPNVINWINNYNDETKEPELLPIVVPLLLINGNFAIGVGICPYMAPHNLSEVIDETRKVLKNPNHIPILIPDMCQPCDIIDNDWKEISKNGSGTFKVRGKTVIGEKNGHPTVTVISCPDQVTTTKVKDSLNDLKKAGQLPTVDNVLDLSKDKANIIITLKKNSDPYTIQDTLYKKCGLQKSYSINFQIVDKTNLTLLPMSYNLYINEFLKFRYNIIFSTVANRQTEISTRLNKLKYYVDIIESGKFKKIQDYVKTLDIIDKSQLSEMIIEKFKINTIQASFILDSTMKMMTAGYISKLKEEISILTSESEKNEEIIRDPNNIYNIIDKELLDIKKKYGKPRICDIIDISNESNIPRGKFDIAILNINDVLYVRKMNVDEKIYSSRGDIIRFYLKNLNNESSIIIFDNKGRTYRIPIYKIPYTGGKSKGIDIRLINKSIVCDITALVYDESLKEIISSKKRYYLVVTSKNNNIKKMDISDFNNVPVSGYYYSVIPNTDSITGIGISNDSLDIVVYSNKNALRMQMKDIPCYKRSSIGVSAMTLEKDEYIEGFSVIQPKCTHIVVLTENGYLNKFNVEGLERSQRNKSGNKIISLKSGDSIYKVYGVNDLQTLTVTTKDDIISIPISDIPILSSISSGTKMIKMKNNNIVKASVE